GMSRLTAHCQGRERGSETWSTQGDRLVSAHFESRGASRSAVAVFPTYLRGIRVARRYLLAATWSSVSGEFRTLSASSFSSRSACVRPPLPSRSHSRHGKDDARHFR